MPQMTDVTDKYLKSVTHFTVNHFYKMLFFVLSMKVTVT